MPEAGICFPRPPLDLWAGEFLEIPRTSSGEPWFNARLVQCTVGVPGGVRDASHGTPHYGPPGQESLQPKRISKINLQGEPRAMETWKRDRSETLLVSRPASPSPMRHALQSRSQRQISRVKINGREKASLWRGLPAAPPSPRLSRWHHRNQRSYKDMAQRLSGEPRRINVYHWPTETPPAQGERQHGAHAESLRGAGMATP